MAPTRGMTRTPSNQNNTAKPTAENMAKPIPRPLLRTASESFSSGVFSPPATTTTPTTEGGKKKGEQKKTRQLHVQHGSESANAMRGKTRNEIRATPGQRREQP